MRDLPEVLKCDGFCYMTNTDPLRSMIDMGIYSTTLPRDISFLVNSGGNKSFIPISKLCLGYSLWKWPAWQVTILTIKTIFLFALQRNLSVNLALIGKPQSGKNKTKKLKTKPQNKTKQENHPTWYFRGRFWVIFVLLIPSQGDHVCSSSRYVYPILTVSGFPTENYFKKHVIDHLFESRNHKHLWNYVVP